MATSFENKTTSVHHPDPSYLESNRFDPHPGLREANVDAFFLCFAACSRCPIWRCRFAWATLRTFHWNSRLGWCKKTWCWLKTAPWLLAPCCSASPVSTNVSGWTWIRSTRRCSNTNGTWKSRWIKSLRRWGKIGPCGVAIGTSAGVMTFWPDTIATLTGIQGFLQMKGLRCSKTWRKASNRRVWVKAHGSRLNIKPCGDSANIPSASFLRSARSWILCTSWKGNHWQQKLCCKTWIVLSPLSFGSTLALTTNISFNPWGNSWLPTLSRNKNALPRSFFAIFSTHLGPWRKR